LGVRRLAAALLDARLASRAFRSHIRASATVAAPQLALESDLRRISPRAFRSLNPEVKFAEAISSPLTSPPHAAEYGSCSYPTEPRHFQ
jgi:hypothetical protein